MDNGGVTENNTANESQNEASPLEGAVAESIAAISEAPPTKRPGRHKKDCQCETCVSRRANPTAPKPEVKTEKKPEIAKAPAIPAEYLMPVVNAPFAHLAAKTGFEGWHLSAEEKKQNAELLEKCMARYFPQLETSHAELVGLSLGLGFAFYGRFLSYQEYRKAQIANNRGKTREANPGNSPERGATDSKIDTGVKPSLALASVLDADQNPAL